MSLFEWWPVMGLFALIVVVCGGVELHLVMQRRAAAKRWHQDRFARVVMRVTCDSPDAELYVERGEDNELRRPVRVGPSQKIRLPQ